VWVHGERKEEKNGELRELLGLEPVCQLDRLRELDRCCDVLFCGEFIAELAAQFGRSHWRH